MQCLKGKTGHGLWRIAEALESYVSSLNAVVTEEPQQSEAIDLQRREIIKCSV